MPLRHGSFIKMQVTKRCLIFSLCIYFTAVTARKDCASKKIPRGGNFEFPADIADTINDKEQLRFSCQIGYTGMVRFTCEDGSWIKNGRGCHPKQCGHPGDTPNGDFTLTKGEDFVFGSEVQYTCKKGYVMVSRVSHRSCLDKGWDNSVPICEVVKCVPIQSSDEMIISGNTEQPQYSDVLQFECRSDDHKLSNPDQIYCTENGEWSGDIPKCEEIRCQYPLIQHGKPRISDTIYKKNDILRFSCEQNYIPVGSGTVRCTKTGWSQQPQCEEQTCSVLYRSDVDEKSFTQSSYKTGEKVYFTCKGGYRKKENTDYITCTEGVWEPRDMCEVMTCSVTDQDPFVVGRSRHYDGLYRVEPYQYRYNCKEGYEKPDRYAYAQCTINGWKPDPLCQTKEKLCNKPPINQGYIYPVKTTYNNEEILYYACITGYKPTTEGWWGHITCTNRAWSHNPKCIDEMNCGILPPIVNGRSWGVQRDEYSNGETVHVQCNTGYEQVRRSAECLNGNWILPECTAVKCEPIKRNEELIMKGNFTQPQYNDVIQFECQSEDHKVKGSDQIRCTEIGEWSGPIPECEEIRCPKPIIANSIHIYGRNFYKNNDILRFVCEENYTPVGNENTRCTKNGWSQQPKCEETGLPCKAPPRIENAVIISPYEETYLHASKVTFKCHPLFGIEGKEEVECRNGNWAVLPRCIRMKCERPEQKINNARLQDEPKEQHDNGTHVHYKCDETFIHTNGTAAICKNGHWSYPFCIRKNYCDKPDLKNGKFIPEKETYNNEEEIEYVCHKPYDSIPAGSVTCQNGQWSEKVECKAKRLSCKELPTIENGDRISEKQEGDLYKEVTFQCPRSYKLEGKEIVRCRNGNWEELPKCLKPCAIENIPEKHHLEKLPSTVYVEEGKTYRFTCKSRYYKDTWYWSTNVEGICKNGHMEFPTFFTMKQKIVILYLIFLECVHALPSTTGCSTLPKVQNADILQEFLKDSYKEGDVLYFSCRAGYVYRKIMYECRNHIWKLNGEGECTLKSCELPEDIAHGRYEIIEGTDFVFGTVIKYFCNEGFQMVSREYTRTCLLEGWSNRQPQCQAVRCSPEINTDGLIVTGLPEDSHMTTGHVLHFKCATTGMTLKGASEVVCLSNGIWSRPFPTCEALTPAPVGRPVGNTFCGPPPQVRYADVVGFQKNTYRHGDNVEFQCQNLYTLVGSKVIKCNQGRWTPEPSCLKPCTVTLEDMNERNLILRHTYMKKLYAKHRQPIEFFCKYGTRKANDIPFRQYCDDGKMILPLCH
ncbi:complement factor H-like [Scleropages formosus]|uniref:complement factor H-like n=1 Tax=Scleropages formosus TaxID=113540 RepID=UPI0010FA7B45|nr:complement factor H-like [Scleropages formosus]